MKRNWKHWLINVSSEEFISTYCNLSYLFHIISLSFSFFFPLILHMHLETINHTSLAERRCRWTQHWWVDVPSTLFPNSSLHHVHPPLLSLGPPLFRSSPPLHSSFSSHAFVFFLFSGSCFEVPMFSLENYSISVTLAVPRSSTQASSTFLHSLHAYGFSPRVFFSGFQPSVSFLQTPFDLSHPFHPLPVAFHNPSQSLSSLFTFFFLPLE